MADAADMSEIMESEEEEEEEEELDAYLQQLNAATPYPALGALGSYQSAVPVELSPVGDGSVLPAGCVPDVGEGAAVGGGVSSGKFGDQPAIANPTSLNEAILLGNAVSLSNFLADLSDEDAREELIECCRSAWVDGEDALVKLARKGNVDMFVAVLAEAWKRCSPQEVLDTVPTGILLTRLARSLVIIMANMEQASDGEAPVSSQLQAVGADMTAMHLAAHHRVGNVVEKLLPRVVSNKGLPPGKANSMIVNVAEHVLGVLEDVLNEADHKGGAPSASQENVVQDLDAVLAMIVVRLPVLQVKHFSRKCFRVPMKAMNRLVGESSACGALALKVVSMVFKYGGEPTWRDLMRLGWANARSVYTMEALEDCVMGAVESAENPFIPGVMLSIALSDAVRGAPEAYQRMFVALHEGVDELLLEVLDRLPQTVRGFRGGMGGVRAIFEPESTGAIPKGCTGPLRSFVLREKQMRTFCVSALVMDYLSRKFTRGLPNLVDSDGVITDKHGLSYLKSTGLVIDGSSSRELSIGQLLQGTVDEYNLTFLPGAQFIIAGIVANPGEYYKVPSLRLIWDLVVYVVMLVCFNNFVLMYDPDPEDDERLAYRELLVGEIAIAVYIVAALDTEIREMRSDLLVYTRDQWNVLDLLGLVLLTCGFVCRTIDRDSSWGRGFYALSAPVVISRLLFYLQLFRFQGPMVQVIFAMTSELSRFLVVMLVVIFGFVHALHALLLDTDKTYGDTWQGVFSAMLGDPHIFEFFMGESSSKIGIALVVLYFIITNVMLLNLLIGLLTTEYERVQEEIDLEYKMSKARLIEHYGTVVDKDWLPAPFNLVQLVVCAPFLLLDVCFGSHMHKSAKAGVGACLFWIVSGTLAVPLGIALWVISAPNAILLRLRNPRRPTDGIPGHQEDGVDSWVSVLEGLMWLPWYLIGAPLCLVGFWLRGAVFSITGATRWFRDDAWGYTPVPKDVAGEENISVGAILEETVNMTVTKLRKYLEDPMIDPEIREDEKDKGATVEHVKLLRDRLENEIGKMVKGGVDVRLRCIEDSLKDLAARDKVREERLDRLQQGLEDILGKLTVEPAEDG